MPPEPTPAPTSAPEHKTPTVKPPAPTSTPGPPGPSGDWKVTSVKEFIALIPDLPEGFPEALWGMPQDKVGREVVATSRVGSDGIPVCTIEGKAFHANKRDMATFLKPLG